MTNEISNEAACGKSFWNCNVRMLKDEQLRKDIEALFLEDTSTNISLLNMDCMIISKVLSR